MDIPPPFVSVTPDTCESPDKSMMAHELSEFLAWAPSYQVELRFSVEQVGLNNQKPPRIQRGFLSSLKILTFTRLAYDDGSKSGSYVTPPSEFLKVYLTFVSADGRFNSCSLRFST